MLVPDEKEMLAKITGQITDLGGNIASLSTFVGEDPATVLLTVKIQDVEEDDLVKAMEPLVIKIVDVRRAPE